MAADNDLAAYAKADLAEISKVIYGQDQVDLKVEVHLPSQSFRELHVNQRALAEEIMPMTSAKDQLTNFLDWAVDKNKENILILWGHGQGPRLKNSKSPFGGIFTASENYAPLSTEILGSILSGHTIDLLIFDMCLMQNLITLEHLKGKAPIVIGSAQIQNFIGLPYDKVINKMRKTMTLENLSKEIVKITAEIMPNDNFTFSAFFNGKNQNIFPALSSLNNELQKLLLTDPYYEFIFSTYFIDLPSFPGSYIDLGMYLGILKKIDYENKVFSVKLRKKIQKVQDEINFSLIEKRYGSEYIEGNRPYFVEFFQGLSVPSENLIFPKL